MMTNPPTYILQRAGWGSVYESGEGVRNTSPPGWALPSETILSVAIARIDVQRRQRRQNHLSGYPAVNADAYISSF